MRRSCRIAAAALVPLALAAGALVAPAVGGELDPNDAALVVLESARRACNEKNYPAGAERFREFLRQYGGHKDAPAAHYGLALALIEGPQ